MDRMKGRTTLIPGMIWSNWGIGEQHRRDLLTEARQHHLLIVARSGRIASSAKTGFRAICITVAQSIFDALAHAGREQPRPGSRSYQDWVP